MSERVFISYSRADIDFARALTATLESDGFDVWIDYDDIQDGERWTQAIERGLDSSDSVVVVMSRSARDSEWVERETLRAMDLKKPVFVALVEDMPLPLHLVNRQFTDFRPESEAGQEVAFTRLLRALHRDSGAALPKLSPEPDADNFFAYVRTRPDGDISAPVARDLFHWAKAHAGSVVEFGGKTQPGFHVRAGGESGVTVFSVWAYARRPALQVQFAYLMKHPPYDSAHTRDAVLKALGKLLGITFDPDQADRRPTIPLNAFDSAEKLEAFQALMAQVLARLDPAS